MKELRFRTILSCFLMLSACPGSLGAQDYHTGIGIKAGMAPGASVKHFFTTNGALEGVLTYRWAGLNLAGLAEFHHPVFDTRGMYLYYGGGLHIGVWDSGEAKDQPPSGRKLNFGIDGIVGLEYVFFDVPLSLGMDWKPNFNVVTDSWLIIDEISLNLKYLLR